MKNLKNVRGWFICVTLNSFSVHWNMGTGKKIGVEDGNSYSTIKHFLNSKKYDEFLKAVFWKLLSLIVANLVYFKNTLNT